MLKVILLLFINRERLIERSKRCTRGQSVGSLGITLGLGGCLNNA